MFRRFGVHYTIFMKSEKTTTLFYTCHTLSHLFTFHQMPFDNFDNQSFDTAKRIAYADDFTGIGRLQQLKYWWEDINKLGPYIGYFPKATKSYLIVKVEHIEEAKALFSSSKIQITVRGNRHLGAIIGDPEFKIEYVNNKVDQWIEQINNLSSIAKTHPHSAYSAFVHGLQHQYTYIMRTIPKHFESATTTRRCNQKSFSTRTS